MVRLLAINIIHLIFFSPLFGQTPIPTSPPNGQVLNFVNPTFSWLGTGIATEYGFRIVEVMDGQSPESALVTNPIWHEATGIRQNLYLYPIHAPRLQSDKTYAWQVIALGSAEQGRQFFMSEISTFKVAKNTSISSKQGSKRKEQQPKLPISNVIHAHLHPTVPLAVHTFKGDTLGFQYGNDYSVFEGEKLQFQVLDISQRPVSWYQPEVIPPTVTVGENRMQLIVDLLEFNKEYQLVVSNSKKQLRYLRFKKLNQ